MAKASVKEKFAVARPFQGDRQPPFDDTPKNRPKEPGPRTVPESPTRLLQVCQAGRTDEAPALFPRFPT